MFISSFLTDLKNLRETIKQSSISLREAILQSPKLSHHDKERSLIDNDEDLALLTEMDKIFSDIEVESTTTLAQLKDLKDLFAKRWKPDSSKDYTLDSSSSIQKLWIALAKKISLVFCEFKKNENFLCILMPGLHHLKAKVNLNLDTLFVSSTGHLYSTNSFWLNLTTAKKNAFEINENRGTRCLSIEELTRLKLKRAPFSFKFKGHTYKSLDDFLTREFFNQSKAEEDISTLPLVEFHRLIEEYFTANTPSAFKAFQEKLICFGNKLITKPAKVVSSFYGTAIVRDSSRTYKGEDLQPKRLFQILVDCLAAPARTELLDAAFVDLDNWLVKKTNASSTIESLSEFHFPTLSLIEFSEQNEPTKIFWQRYLKNKTKNLKKKNDEYTPLFRQLFELIQDYYQDKSLFQQRLVTFLHNLCHYPAAEANDFCLRQIDIHNKQFSLIELLYLCTINPDKASDYLKPLAKKIADINPSLISNAEELMSVYQEIKMGLFFDNTELKKIIEQLPIEENLILAKKLNSLRQQIIDHIDSSDTWGIILKKIEALYSLYWKEIKDSPFDYFRPTKGQIEKNALWIRLAKLLQGSGQLGYSYYKLLIPSLGQDIDEITQYPVDDLPPQDCILSEDETYLIYLPTSANLHKSCNVFGKLVGAEIVTLSAIEILRLSQNPVFYELFRSVYPRDPSLSKNTVLALAHIINGTYVKKDKPFNFNTARATIESDEIVTDAEGKMYQLVALLQTLSEEEEQNLYLQFVNAGYKRMSFRELLSEAQAQVKDTEDRRCFGGVMTYVMQIVMSYAPWFPFSPTIKATIPSYFQHASNTRLYKEYAEMDALQIKAHLARLAYSFMTHNFSSTLSSIFDLDDNNFTLRRKENYIPNSFKSIGTILSYALDSEEPSFGYARLIESQGGKQGWAKHESFSPEVLLIECNKLLGQHSFVPERPEFCLSLTPLLEELSALLLNTEDFYERWFTANDSFFNFLESLEKKEQDSLLANLKALTNVEVNELHDVLIKLIEAKSVIITDEISSPKIESSNPFRFFTSPEPRPVVDDSRDNEPEMDDIEIYLMKLRARNQTSPIPIISSKKEKESYQAFSY